MSTIRQGIIGTALLAGSIVLSAAGQLGMKVGMQEYRGGAAIIDTQVSMLHMLGDPVLWTTAGLFAYGISMLVWLAALARYPLSYAYPLLSLSYVLVYIGATQWSRLSEVATPLRTTGTLLILVGVCLVSLTESRGSSASRNATEGGS